MLLSCPPQIGRIPFVFSSRISDRFPLCVTRLVARYRHFLSCCAAVQALIRFRLRGEAFPAVMICPEKKDKMGWLRFCLGESKQIKHETALDTRKGVGSLPLLSVLCRLDHLDTKWLLLLLIAHFSPEGDYAVETVSYLVRCTDEGTSLLSSNLEESCSCPMTPRLGIWIFCLLVALEKPTVKAAHLLFFIFL